MGAALSFLCSRPNKASRYCIGAKITTPCQLWQIFFDHMEEKEPLLLSDVTKLGADQSLNVDRTVTQERLHQAITFVYIKFYLSTYKNYPSSWIFWLIKKPECVWGPGMQYYSTAHFCRKELPWEKLENLNFTSSKQWGTAVLINCS